MAEAKTPDVRGAPGLNAAGLNAAGLNAAGLNAAGLNAAGLNAAGFGAPGFGARGFVGEMAVAPDGTVEGWCCDPARPDLRVWVEILAEDRRLALVPARRRRDDLRERGIGDGQYGFRVTLPLADLSATEVLIRARMCGHRWAFGQRLLPRPGLPAPPVPLDGLGQATDRLSAALVLLREPETRTKPWTEAFRALSIRLAGAPALPSLPLLRAPKLSLVAPLRAGLEAALVRLGELAALAHGEAAEIIAVVPHDQPELLLLPGLVTNLRLVTSDGDIAAVAATEARGERIAVLAEQGSPAALREVLRHGPPRLFGPASPRTLAPWVMPVSPGLTALLPGEDIRGLGHGASWGMVLARANHAQLACWRLVVA